ncbi:MAG: tRNA pseudouridine(65) synthase TruC [Alteromonadaceae bacterium]|nr:tRNA pseudouridine(65) synthase TruC [Alteromonadaceae bacterium]
MVELDILYQDEHCVAVFKPSGLLVHRSLIDKYETQFAMQILRDQLGQRVYPLHRLDKATSGVLLFGLSSNVAKQFGKLFENNQVHKTYLAIVRGYLEGEGTVDYPLKETLDKMVDKKARQDKPAQAAVSHFSNLATIELPYAVGRYNTARYSIVQLQPDTGRKHQLRRHMAHLRHPILGDVNYGDNKHNRFVREQMAFNGLALTAKRMRFVHPITQEDIVVESKVETRFKQLLSNWGMVDSDINAIWSN